jgi:biotin carboxylase
VLAQFAAERGLALDFTDIAEGCRQIEAYAADYPLTAILGVDDETLLLAATACAALGLVHNSPDSVIATRNKYRFRGALANAGPPSPEFRLVGIDPDEAAPAARIAPYPCVLKPLALAASRGVIRADDEAGFIAAHRRIAAILQAPDVAAIQGEAARQILVESFIPGVEVALEGLLHDGELETLALFDKPDPLNGPYFEETIFVTPSRLSAAIQDDIAQAARQAVAALGLRHGPIHAEFRVNDKGVWPLEMAARSIGGLCARTLNFGAGLGLEALILRHALGLPISRPISGPNSGREPDQRPAGVMMIPTPESGTLREVRGLEAARAVAGISDITISIAPGHPVAPPPEGYRYLGFIFAQGDSPDAVEAALRGAHAKLEIVIDPGH